MNVWGRYGIYNMKWVITFSDIFMLVVTNEKEFFSFREAKSKPFLGIHVSDGPMGM